MGAPSGGPLPDCPPLVERSPSHGHTGSDTSACTRAAIQPFLRLTPWAAAAQTRLLSWHEDQGISGGAELERRPGLVAALDALRDQGAGVLVVARRDRLARDVLTDALVQRLCEREGATVVSADGVANGDQGLGIELVRGLYEGRMVRGWDPGRHALRDLGSE